VLGLALGVLYVPCAGPILAAITVVGATHRVGLTAVILTAAFAVGTAVPLLAVAVAGGQLSGRVAALRRRAPRIRQAGGAVLVAIAVAIAFNAFAGLQRDVPGYSTALQGSGKIRNQLNALTGEPHTTLSKCNSTATTLVNCGPAPNFKGITQWLNTAGGKPLTIASLRGKVVLVDFWTYSCINCQRTLPHVEAWYSTYAKDGFVVVGVHTPEFAFEHVVSNVRDQAAALGVRYPVAIDDNYATWNAYSNQYWPADYLIDAKGNVRHVHFGEGDYATTESLIRQLLTTAHPGLALPHATDIPDPDPRRRDEPGDLRRLPAAPVPGTEQPGRAGRGHRLPLPGHAAAGRHGTVGDLDRQRPGSDRGQQRPARTGFPGSGRLPGARRARDAGRLGQRPPGEDHRRERGAAAVHPVPGGLAGQRQAAAARLARRPGLRLHLRLTVCGRGRRGP
jgi:thiol-disulfide isomerase/thioredoxin